MELKHKPNFEETKVAFNHFWAKEAWKRPLVWAGVRKDPSKPFPLPEHPLDRRYYRAISGEWDQFFDAIDIWMDDTLFLAEALPAVNPDFGPDQFGAFLGGELKFAESSPTTNWVDPIVDDWSTFEIRLDPENPTWKSVRAFARRLSERAKGRYLVGICDLHSHADALSAIRGPQRFCLDFCDFPDEVEKAMLAVRKLFQPVYNGLSEASGLNRETGSSSWAPFWCEGKFAVIQCDFICMVSPEMSRKYIIPAIEEEASFLDHCVYHLDGPGALPHLDDILAIKEIDVIQWVSGDGQPKMWTWTDVLKRCLKAGKGLQIYDINPEQVKAVHRELGSQQIMYAVNAQDAAEVEELTTWLERNS